MPKKFEKYFYLTNRTDNSEGRPCPLHQSHSTEQDYTVNEGSVRLKKCTHLTCQISFGALGKLQNTTNQ